MSYDHHQLGTILHRLTSTYHHQTLKATVSTLTESRFNMRYSLEAIFTFVLLGSTTASSGPLRLPQITYPSNVGCGEVNVFYT